MKTREAQIEEIAEEMCEEYGTALCSECDSYGKCDNKFIAEKLYDAGYRKQNDTVREILKLIILDYGVEVEE